MNEKNEHMSDEVEKSIDAILSEGQSKIDDQKMLRAIERRSDEDDNGIAMMVRA